MNCGWKELLSILPQRLRQPVDNLGRDGLQELRLRLGAPPELVISGQSRWLTGMVTEEELAFCVNTASRYSPWAAETISRGYLTAPGGHRMGLCGAVMEKAPGSGILRQVTSACIRVARDYPGVSGKEGQQGSILILGAPGWGKTTLLRDLARRRAEEEQVSVVDERGELFPAGIRRGRRMDVLTGERKVRGIERMIRTMSPQWIAVDEITAQEDCEALVQAAGCGVKLLATAHAGSAEEFLQRPVYRHLRGLGLFDWCMILDRNKSFRTERMNI